MKTIVPDYYHDFACLMGACRHSCCIGWEIDIDENSLDYFLSLGGEIGQALRENINQSGEVPCFRLAEDERCPFLNRDGLCRLILELGEDSLCDICADHPRYRNFFSDREEIGLGLCCEGAGRILLGRQAPVEFIVEDDDGGDEPLTEDELILLSLRSELTAIMQDRRFSVEDRVKKLIRAAQIQLLPFDSARWAPFLLKLERLDDAWTHLLEALSCRPTRPANPLPSVLDTPFEQLMVYLLHRHLPGALEDDDLSGRIAFCIRIWELIRALCCLEANCSFENLCELCRLFSAEIEYSDENIGAILDELHRENPLL